MLGRSHLVRTGGVPTVDVKRLSAEKIGGVTSDWLVFISKICIFYESIIRAAFVSYMCFLSKVSLKIRFLGKNKAPK